MSGEKLYGWEALGLNGNLPCEHGRQRRKCEVCELIQTEEELEDLRADNVYLVGRVKVLEDSLVGAYRQAKSPTDHACLQCAPYSELVIEGFVCWWHLGEALARSARAALRGEEP